MQSESRSVILALIAVALSSACSDQPVAVSHAAIQMESQASVTGSQRDHDAIQQIVDTFDQTWGNDAATYAAQYGNLIDWVGPFANVLTDPAAITALYTGLFSGVFAGTQRTSTIRKLTFLTGTIAVLDIDTNVQGVAGALERNVLIKRGGEWTIYMHQQTLKP
jgi:hypothetical protein